MECISRNKKTFAATVKGSSAFAFFLVSVGFSLNSQAWNTRAGFSSGSSYSKYTWTGAVSTNWSTPGNWCGAYIDGACQGATTAPGATDTVVFDSVCGSNCTANLTANVTVGAIMMQSNYTGTINQGAFTFTAGGGLNTSFLASGTFNAGSAALTFSSGSKDSFVMTGGIFNGGSGSITLTNALTYSGGTIALSNGTFTSSSGSSTVSGGTFNGGSGAVTFTNLAISGSVAFTSTSGNLTCNGTCTIATGTTFNHNSGLFTIAGTIANITSDIGFYDVSFFRATGNLALTGTVTVSHNLTLGCTSGNPYFLNGGIVNVSGDVNVINNSISGSTLQVRFVGGGAQNLTMTGSNYMPKVEIAKTAATTVTFNNANFGADFKYTSGNITFATPSVTFRGLLSIDSSTIVWPTTRLLGTFSTEHKTIVGTMYVAGDFYDYGQQIKVGTVEVTGDVYSDSDAAGGTGTIKLTGSSAQKIVGAASLNTQILPNVEIASSSTVTFQNIVSLQSFTYTSGALMTTGSTVEFYGGTVTAGATQFQKVVFTGGSSAHNVSIVGTLCALSDVSSSATAQLTGGTIDVQGNITMFSSTTITTAWKLTGSNVQNVTLVSIRTGGITVTKSGGSVELASDLVLSSSAAPFNITAGIVNINGFNLTWKKTTGGGAAVFTIGAGTTVNRGGGTLTSDTLVVNGTLN